MRSLTSGERQRPYRGIMGNLADRVGTRKRLVRDTSSVQRLLLSNSTDVSAMIGSP